VRVFFFSAGRVPRRRAAEEKREKPSARKRNKRLTLLAVGLDPRQVRELRVDRDAEDLGVELLELLVAVREGRDLGGAVEWGQRRRRRAAVRRRARADESERERAARAHKKKQTKPKKLTRQR